MARGREASASGRRRLLAAAALAGALVAGAPRAARACTALGVGKAASATGGTLIAHTDDAGGNPNDLRLVKVPAKDHAPGALRAVYPDDAGYPRIVDASRAAGYAPEPGQLPSTPIGFVPEVAHTYAYWDQDYGLMNEKQVAMAESTCGARFGAKGRHEGGAALFDMYELSKIGLERCATARCAAETMGKMAEEHGFFAGLALGGAGEAQVVADPEEVWVFNVLPDPSGASAIWAAQRVPDDHITVVANDFTIGVVDFGDAANFMTSANITGVALEQGLWEPGTPFNFYTVFGYQPLPVGSLPYEIDKAYTGRRMWRAYTTLNPALDIGPDDGHNPLHQLNFSYPAAADGKVEREAVMELLGDHYEGTKYDLTRGAAAGPFGDPNRVDMGLREAGVTGGFERAIGSYRTTYTQICELRPLPDFHGGILWYGQGTGDAAVHTPLFVAQLLVADRFGLPASYYYGSQYQFSADSAWWPFAFVDNWIRLGYKQMLPVVHEEQAKLRAEAAALVERVDALAAGAWDEGRAVHRVYRAGFEFAEELPKRWWAFGQRLIGVYQGSWITTGDAKGDRKAFVYNKDFLLAGGYDAWPELPAPALGAAAAAEAAAEAAVPGADPVLDAGAGGASRAAAATPSEADECKALVKKNLPLIVEFIEDEDPASACALVGFECDVPPTPVGPPARLRHARSVAVLAPWGASVRPKAEDAECELCELALLYAQKVLEQKGTPEEIEAALDKYVCDAIGTN